MVAGEKPAFSALQTWGINTGLGPGCLLCIYPMRDTFSTFGGKCRKSLSIWGESAQIEWQEVISWNLRTGSQPKDWTWRGQQSVNLKCPGDPSSLPPQPQSCLGCRWLGEPEAPAWPVSWDSVLSPTPAPPRFREGSESIALRWENTSDLPTANIQRGHVLFGTAVRGRSCTFGTP